MIFENDKEQALFEQFMAWRKNNGNAAYKYYNEEFNPFAPDTLNLAAQNELVALNPKLALKLAKEAKNTVQYNMIKSFLAEKEGENLVKNYIFEAEK